MFSPADLPITDAGRIYHLNLRPEDLAGAVILVGDPERVPLIAKAHFAELELDESHRGLRTMTGRVKDSGLRLTVTTSGMGTPSLEIVLQELAALNEIDFSRRERKSAFRPLHLVRVGTSGALSRETTLGTAILSEYAVGLDNAGVFYDVECPDEPAAELERRCRELMNGAVRTNRFAGCCNPYAAKADPAVQRALVAAADALGVPYKRGVTVTNAGFFAGQGRDVARVRPSYQDLDRAFGAAATGIDGLAFENMEMEAALLLHFAAGAGYPAGVICPVIAHRAEETFSPSFVHDVERAAAVAVRALVELTS